MVVKGEDTVLHPKANWNVHSMISATPMSEILKSAKRQHFSSRKYGESVANLCPVLASTLCSCFLLKKMLKSALGSVRENSNNPSVVLNVWFLTFCLLLCEWNTSMEVVRCVRVVDMCVYSWCLRGRNHLSTCRKCLTLSSPHPTEAASLGASPGKQFHQVPKEKPAPLNLENHQFHVSTHCWRI